MWIARSWGRKFEKRIPGASIISKIGGLYSRKVIRKGAMEGRIFLTFPSISLSFLILLLSVSTDIYLYWFLFLLLPTSIAFYLSVFPPGILSIFLVFKFYCFLTLLLSIFIAFYLEGFLFLLLSISNTFYLCNIPFLLLSISFPFHPFCFLFLRPSVSLRLIRFFQQEFNFIENPTSMLRARTKDRTR